MVKKISLRLLVKFHSLAAEVSVFGHCLGPSLPAGAAPADEGGPTAP